MEEPDDARQLPHRALLRRRPPRLRARVGQDWWTIVGLGLLALICSTRTVVRRPDLVKGGDFLFADVGHNLLVADRLASGATLYEDVSFPYGPLSAYLYAWLARVWGNTPDVYLGLFAVLSAVNVCLGFVLIRRVVPWPAAVGLSIALGSVLIIPGSLTGAFTSSPFIVIERTLLLLLSLRWSNPLRRTMRSSVELGVILGIWQGVKFGGAAVAGTAVVLVDLLTLRKAGAGSDCVRAWLRQILITVAIFAGIEGTWLIYALLTLPHDIALDVMWPLYMYESYTFVVTSDIRWPRWHGWRLAVGQYLLPCSAGLLGVLGLWRWWCSDAPKRQLSDSVGGLSIPLLFYTVGCFGYFRHEFHFQQFLWALVPASGIGVAVASQRLRAATVLAFLPGILLVVRAVFVSPSAIKVLTPLPRGGALAVDKRIAERLTALRDLAQKVDGAPIMLGPVGSGWHYEYAPTIVGRHSFFFAPQVIRPYERDAFIQSLDRVAVVVACDRPQLAPGAALNLPADMARELNSRFHHERSVAGCDVYRPVRPAIKADEGPGQNARSAFEAASIWRR